MFKNYFLLTFRNISRQKVSSLIAILGLSLGITSALLLYTYIDYHRSYEDFMPENSNVKRLVSKRIIDGDAIYSGSGSISPYSAKLLKDNISSITEMTSIKQVSDNSLIVDNSEYIERILYINPNFFDLIPLPILKGEKENLLKNPNSIVLNNELAKKFFPDGDALGKKIILQQNNKNIILQVSGVVEIPSNSHLYESGRPPAFVNVKLLADNIRDYYDPKSDRRIAVYFKPVENFNRDILYYEIQDFLSMIPTPEVYPITELFYEDFEDIHLFSREDSDFLKPFIIIIFLGLVTLALLSISVINSISILTAQSIGRTREVGVKLVLGSSKKDLIFQFLTESIIFSYISLIFALILSELLQPSFSNFVSIELNYSYSPAFALYIIVLTLIVGILSGLYPAFYLSSLKVVDSLKGKTLLKLKKSKKILIVIQFIFAAIILIWTFTFNNEMKYLQKTDLGFNRENIISIIPGKNFNLEPYEKLKSLKKELKKIEGVTDVTHSTFFPFTGAFEIGEDIYISEDGVTSYPEYFTSVDDDYLNVLEITPIEGQVEIGSVIAMKRACDYRDLSIGDLIELDSMTYKVSCIIEDYYQESVFYENRCMFHIVSNDSFDLQTIKVGKKIDFNLIKNAWRTIYGDEFSIIDHAHISTVIENENTPIEVKMLIKTLNWAMAITLFITILGLFGLTLHTIKQKTQEIGIRKVLGASYYDVIELFIKEMGSLIIISLFIGIPLGVFSVKIGIYALGYSNPPQNMFGIALFSAVVILLTGISFVGLMVIKAARSNPSDALRYE